MKKAMVLCFSILFVTTLIVTAMIFPNLRKAYEENRENAFSDDRHIGTISTPQDDTTEHAEPPSSNDNESTSAQTETKPETLATDFTIYDKDGNSVNLRNFVGKPTIVNFWATWCGYCVEELPDFHRLYEEYCDSVNFVMLDLPDGFRETQSKALKFAENRGYKFPIYFDLDHSASRTYSVSGIPMTLFIDKDGRLYQRHSGMITEVTLRRYIEALLGGTK